MGGAPFPVTPLHPIIVGIIVASVVDKVPDNARDKVQVAGEH
jgi:hypothetical protein